MEGDAKEGRERLPLLSFGTVSRVSFARLSQAFLARIVVTVCLVSTRWNFSHG